MLASSLNTNERRAEAILEPPTEIPKTWKIPLDDHWNIRILIVGTEYALSRFFGNSVRALVVQSVPNQAPGRGLEVVENALWVRSRLVCSERVGRRGDDLELEPLLEAVWVHDRNAPGIVDGMLDRGNVPCSRGHHAPPNCPAATVAGEFC
jgi:hypothetical protein